MMFVEKILRISSLLTLTALLPCLALAQARDGKPEPRPAQTGATPTLERASFTNDNAGRNASGAESIELLKSKVEQLQSVVEQQQRALAEMQKNIEALTGKAALLEQASASSPAAGSRAATPLAATESAQANKGAAAPAPAQGESRAGEKPAALAGWDKDHAFLRSADGAFETRLTGFSHFDFRGYESGNHPPNTFLVRRARIALEGKLARYYDFKVEGDFADTTSTLLRDFYLNIHRVDEFQVRFGQFKEPFSQEETRADIYQDFVERSLVNNLAPSRSPGLMVSGVLGKGAFEYQVGAFNGKGLLAANNNGTPESVIRLRFAPWKSSQALPLKGLAFGGAFAQGRSFGGASVRGQTESRSFTYFTPDAVNGKIIRANGELTWVHGPAAIRAEYDQTNQERENLGPGGRNLPGVVAKGYMAQATYLLTGETKPDAGIVTPKRNLFSGEGGHQGFGAWELKFRFASLQIADGTAKSNRAETIYFGTNWYMNRFIKYVLDLGFERFHDPVRSPNPGDRNYFVVLSRIQLAF
ncbi:MAG TPA: porin [Blastocatellia bacterium]|nr:porin [Blastocatellia bacterium]